MSFLLSAKPSLLRAWIPNSLLTLILSNVYSIIFQPSLVHNSITSFSWSASHSCFLLEDHSWTFRDQRFLCMHGGIMNIYKKSSIFINFHLFSVICTCLYSLSMGGIYGWISKLKIKGSHVLLILYAVGKIFTTLLSSGGFSDFVFFIFFFFQLHEIILTEHFLLYWLKID